MTTLSFVCIARDAGRAVWDLCHDLAGLVRPGDEVIWIDDTGTPDGAAVWLGRFHAMVGWPPGVRVETVITGTRGAGDAGIAINLGLGMAGGDAVLVLPGRARLNSDAVARARDRLYDSDVVACAWTCADPDHPADTRVLGGAARLSGLMFRRDRVTGNAQPFCDEGRTDWGELRLIWTLDRHTGPADPDALAIGRMPPWPTDAGALFAAAADLTAQQPAAAPWIMQNMSDWLCGSGHGAVSAVLDEATPWATGIAPVRTPDSPRTAPGAAMIAAVQACDPDTARRMARQLCRRPALPAPARTGAAPIRLWLEGVHTRRTPFAYAALAPLWADSIAICDDPAAADLIVLAHPVDLLGLRADTARVLEGNRVPTALISEEPFWDSLFSPAPLASRVTLRAAHLGGLPAHQINHHMSPIFDFARIPYILLTEPGFIARYRLQFARNAARSAADWQDALANRSGRAVFMAERRPESFHDIALPHGDLLGLCAWRTRLAETYRTGVVDRLGASWHGGPTRFDLPDWHADKITSLDGRAELISALENTHQPTYISEKLFDAFACGARPLYLASPGHRVHDLGLPPASWINLWGLDSTDAPRAIDSAPAFVEVAADYALAQQALATLFHDDALLDQERTRLGAAVQAEVARVMDLGPA